MIVKERSLLGRPCCSSQRTLAACSFLIVVLLWLVVWVRSQDEEILNHRVLRQVLISGKLSSLAVPNKHRCVVGLEACDALRLSCLSHSVDGVSDADLRLDGLQLLVQSDHHARVDRQSQVEQEVVVLPCNECFHVRGRNQYRQ